MKRTLDPAVFLTLATFSLGDKSLAHSVISAKTKERRFLMTFGITATLCAKLWTLCLPNLLEEQQQRQRKRIPLEEEKEKKKGGFDASAAQPVHLLWTLYFLKHYHVEHDNAVFANCDVKTYRKWCWIMIEALSTLNLVRVESLSPPPLDGCVSHSYVVDSYIVVVVCGLKFSFFFGCSMPYIDRVGGPGV
jgi:hypothetical protein